MSIDAESLDHERLVEQLLKHMLRELIKINAQHEFITNEVIEDYDIEEKIDDHN